MVERSLKMFNWFFSRTTQQYLKIINVVENSKQKTKKKTYRDKPYNGPYFVYRSYGFFLFRWQISFWDCTNTQIMAIRIIQLQLYIYIFSVDQRKKNCMNETMKWLCNLLEPEREAPDEPRPDAEGPHPVTPCTPTLDGEPNHRGLPGKRRDSNLLRKTHNATFYYYYIKIRHKH